MSCFCIIEAYTAGGRVRPKMTVGAAYGPCLSLAAGSGNGPGGLHLSQVSQVQNNELSDGGQGGSRRSAADEYLKPVLFTPRCTTTDFSQKGLMHSGSSLYSTHCVCRHITKVHDTAFNSVSVFKCRGLCITTHTVHYNQLEKK